MYQKRNCKNQLNSIINLICSTIQFYLTYQLPSYYSHPYPTAHVLSAPLHLASPIQPQYRCMLLMKHPSQPFASSFLQIALLFGCLGSRIGCTLSIIRECGLSGLYIRFRLLFFIGLSQVLQSFAFAFEFLISFFGVRQVRLLIRVAAFVSHQKIICNMPSILLE
ncbi:hypothetical protein FGO68_gene4772 [Halteria grandinella]|uniref:Uncharacterized protein n=1 Tax=Halteria grandinella TaxID=5974 RepID=A0A8J8NIP7_HALGN|nr:hypothetical protein FGO68_gene4772 [Halteria grandinella]